MCLFWLEQFGRLPATYCSVFGEVKHSEFQQIIRKTHNNARSYLCQLCTDFAYLKQRRKSEVCEFMKSEQKSSSVQIHWLTGVFSAYVHKLTFRMYIFEYVINADSTGVIGVLLEKPDGDANSTNMSLAGFVLAADSIAQACLLLWEE